MGGREPSVSGLLLDTRMIAWVLLDSPRLEEQHRRLIERADRVAMSPISLYEIGRKAHLAKWPEMLPFLAELTNAVDSTGLESLPITNAITQTAAGLDWSNRDPFDRIIAATAIRHDLPVLTIDRRFAELKTLRLPLERGA